ncbi:MAG: hypothetical protein PVH00_07525 [Gemmatimonadota bacterium]|jgi:hypothetical protein
MKTEKTTRQTTQPAAGKAPTQEEMRTAYEAHTLAQMLYGRMAGVQPWMAQTSWGPELPHAPASSQPFPPAQGFTPYPFAQPYQPFPGGTWAGPAYTGYPHPMATGFFRHHWIW